MFGVEFEIGKVVEGSFVLVLVPVQTLLSMSTQSYRVVVVSNSGIADSYIGCDSGLESELAYPAPSGPPSSVTNPSAAVTPADSSSDSLDFPALIPYPQNPDNYTLVPLRNHLH